MLITLPPAQLILTLLRPIWIPSPLCCPILLQYLSSPLTFFQLLHTTHPWNLPPLPPHYTLTKLGACITECGINKNDVDTLQVWLYNSIDDAGDMKKLHRGGRNGERMEREGNNKDEDTSSNRIIEYDDGKPLELSYEAVGVIFKPDRVLGSCPRYTSSLLTLLSLSGEIVDLNIPLKSIREGAWNRIFFIDELI